MGLAAASLVVSTNLFAQTPPVRAPDSLALRVDSLLARWDSSKGPGCAIGVMRDGRFLYRRGAGMANLEHSVAITPSSVFYLASTSKQFTAFVVAALARDGKLSLDDGIRRYIPELPEYATPITIRQMLHHTSGLRDYLILMSLGEVDQDNYFTPDYVLDLVSRQRALDFPPGTAFRYSNTGYALLAQFVIPRVTGKSLREAADELLFGPLGMGSTLFHDNHRRIVRHRADGYLPGTGGTLQIASNSMDLVGDGGLLSSVEDLLLWEQNFLSGRVGGAAVVNQLSVPGRLLTGDTLRYGMGINLGSYRGLRTVSHGGSMKGYVSEYVRFPDQRLSVATLCNLGTINTWSLARRVAEVYLAPHFAGSPASAAASAHRLVHVPEASLRTRAGSYYQTETGVVWELAFDEGRLHLLAGGGRFALGAVDSSRFVTVGAPFAGEIELHANALSASVNWERPRLYQRFRHHAYAPGELEDYVGEYQSDELGIRYVVRLQSGRLTVQGPRYPAGQLMPLLKDHFATAGNTTLAFQRDGPRRVTGLVLNSVWVQGIDFRRTVAPTR